MNQSMTVDRSGTASTGSDPADGAPAPAGRRSVSSPPGSGTGRLHYDDLGQVPGLLGWAKVFARFTGPRVLAGAATAAIVRRVRLGRWRWADAWVAAMVVVLHPFAEWWVHVRVLHRRRRSGLAPETFAARMHRRHHEDPKDVELVLLPLRSVAGLVAGIWVSALVARDRRRGATAAATSLVSLLAYEWMHFLIHSSYRPKRSWYRARWRAHRLHHYRSERYWFGVVGTVADRVFGTAPQRSEVAISPTARTLGVAGAADPGTRPHEAATEVGASDRPTGAGADAEDGVRP